MKSLAIIFIRGYQLIFSPLLTQILVTAFGFSATCRYPETCSRYTLRQIQAHGVRRGAWLGCLRILSCWGWRQ